MIDGRIAALAVLVIGLLALGAYFFFEYVRHGRSESRNRHAERIPLFGTDYLATGTGPERPVMQRPEHPVARAATTAAGVNGATRAAAARDQDAPALVNEVTAPGARVAAAAARPNGNGSYTSDRADLLEVSAPQPVSATALGATDTHQAISTAARASAASTLEAAVHHGETLRFSIPDEGTLQFLPGRLEVTGGRDAGREVRFVRTPGEDSVEVTFGRSEGPAYRHVQLLARTVSRQHAVMSLLDGHWSLQNLSATNPVVLNSRPLAPGEVAPLLVDGDRIEMGEIVFLFHSH
jgi:hypothetical protein